MSSVLQSAYQELALANQRKQAEIERLRAERDALLAEKNHLKDWKERAFKAEDEIDRLREALLEYGHHRAGCIWVRDVDDKCDCGWREIAKAAKEGE